SATCRATTGGGRSTTSRFARCSAAALSERCAAGARASAALLRLGGCARGAAGPGLAGGAPRGSAVGGAHGGQALGLPQHVHVVGSQAGGGEGGVACCGQLAAGEVDHGLGVEEVAARPGALQGGLDAVERLAIAALGERQVPRDAV